MKVVDFIANSKNMDTPVGDLAKDTDRDKSFPVDKSDDEVLRYLHGKCFMHNNHEAFEEFLQEYKSFNSLCDYEIDA